jgi:ketosteroid isomerase-like protein
MNTHSFKNLFSSFLAYLLLTISLSSQEAVPAKTQTYTPNAVKIFEDGNYITGADSILAWWAGQTNKIRDYEILETIPSHQPDRIRYELSTIDMTDGRRFHQLIIWNVEEKIPRRELEMVSEARATDPYTSALDTRRADWMRLCNAHNAKQLVEALYTENALYYNHKPLIQGQEAIAADYTYMNNPDYQLTLTPIRVLPVSTDLAFEIGQCSGSYGGNYVLVWQKGKDSIWRILLDSNI